MVAIVIMFILVLLTSSIKMLWQYSCISTNYSQHFQFLFVLYMYIYMHMYFFVYFMNYRNLNRVSPLETSINILYQSCVHFLHIHVHVTGEHVL